MNERLQKKFDELEILFVPHGYGTEAVVTLDDVEELLKSITHGEYCDACGGGMALSRHDD